MTRNEVSLDFLYHPVVFFVSLVRFGSAFSILLFPFWGFLISVLFDILDAQVLLHIIGLSRKEYQVWDKVVDWFAYLTEFLVAISYGLYLPFFLLLFWRFCGQYMFMYSEKTISFILFPNLFETAYLWLIIFHPVIAPIDLSLPQPWSWLIIFFIVKEIQEISVHFIWPKYLLPYTEDKTRIFWQKILRH